MSVLLKILQFIPFACVHPHAFLHVAGEHTESDLGDGYTKVTYRLYCMKCRKELPVSYARGPEVRK